MSKATWGTAFDDGDQEVPVDLHSAWQLAYDGDRKNNSLYRMRVPNGWLYRLEGSKYMTYVPDA